MTTAKATKGIIPMTCIRNDGSLPLQITLKAMEFTWNCPSVQQPDFGVIVIEYKPKASVVETKSLKFYLQQYRYKNAFAEEMVTRICLDFAFYIRPSSVSVTLHQNSRGGIENHVTARYDENTNSGDMALAKYQPKETFRGGWPEVPA